MTQTFAPLTVVAERPRPGVRLLRLAGEIDIATVPELRAALRTPDDGVPDLVIDLGEVTLLSAAGLGALVECRRSQRRMLLARADHPAVRLTLSCTALDEVFPRYPGVAEALAALGRSRG